MKDADKLSGKVKQINDKGEYSESKKSGVRGRELERELDKLALLELRRKEFCLRIRPILEVPAENTKGRLINVLAIFLDPNEDKENKMDKMLKLIPDLPD